MNNDDLDPRWKKRFEAFMEESGGGKYTPDFNASLEAIMRDRKAHPTERLLSAIKRFAWGNHSLFAVSKDGRPLGQVDLAKELGGLNKRVVSKATRKLVERGVVKVEQRRIYPVVSPEQKVSNIRDFSSPDFRLFEAQWFVDHPDEESRFKAAQAAEKVAQAVEKEVKNRMLSDYKAFRKSARQKTTQNSGKTQSRQKDNHTGDDDSSTPPTDKEPDLIDKNTELKTSVESSSSVASNGTTTKLPSKEIPTTGPEDFVGMRILSRKDFESLLIQIFVDAGLSTPGEPQLSFCSCHLEPAAYQPYANQLRDKCNRKGIHGPGVLKPDVKAFMRAWPLLKKRLTEEATHEQSAAQTREEEIQRAIAYNKREAAKDQLKDPFLDARQRAAIIAENPGLGYYTEEFAVRHQVEIILNVAQQYPAMKGSDDLRKLEERWPDLVADVKRRRAG